MIFDLEKNPTKKTNGLAKQEAFAANARETNTSFGSSSSSSSLLDISEFVVVRKRKEKKRIRIRIRRIDETIINMIISHCHQFVEGTILYLLLLFFSSSSSLQSSFSLPNNNNNNKSKLALMSCLPFGIFSR